MTDASRAFVQALLSTNSITAAEAEDLVEELNELGGEKKELDEMLTEANLSLQPFNTKIIKSRHPRLEQWVLSTINIQDVDEKEYRLDLSQEKFLALIGSMFNACRDYERSMRSLTSAKISSQDVWAFVDEGWIEQQDNGNFIPTSKLLYRGEKHLKENYESDGHLLRCLGCDGYVIFGRFCNNKNCTGATHRRCDRPYRQKEKLEANACPICSGSFAEPNNDDE